MCLCRPMYSETQLRWWHEPSHAPGSRFQWHEVYSDFSAIFSRTFSWLNELFMRTLIGFQIWFYMRLHFAYMWFYTSFFTHLPLLPTKRFHFARMYLFLPGFSQYRAPHWRCFLRSLLIMMLLPIDENVLCLPYGLLCHRISNPFVVRLDPTVQLGPRLWGS